MTTPRQPRIDLCPEGFSEYRHDNPTAKGWTSECPNMKSVPGDTSMESDRYRCPLCGRTVTLYHDEMR